MKILYQDLINHFVEKPSKKLLSEKLFQLGHEHEIYGDILNMELTPNRGDCLSLTGLARDLNVFFGKSEPINIFKDKIDALEIDFENRSSLDCPKISFLEIEIEEKTSEYKPYLENYFNTVGNNKTNFFTDISNYISYELGQPTHCYERSAISKKLIFENKKNTNIFQTVLGNEIKLTDSNCVFTIDNKIINLAGVMGGIETACSLNTKKVLVECAYFNPESIIGKSIKYNLVSDASHKFERGVDIASHDMVLRRFAWIVQDHVKIKSIKLKSFIEAEYQKIFIPINTNKINRILGTSIEDTDYIRYLKGLGFIISDRMIEVPSYRHDIKTDNDLAEEVARVIGYNNIKSAPTELKKTIDNINDDNVTRLENFLVEKGFSEVINFPFTEKKENESIAIDNPLDSNRNHMRTLLMDSLIHNLLYNERRQKESIKLFEISDIYSKDKKIRQQKKLGLIISGRAGNNFKDFTKKLDYKYLNNLLNGDSDEDIFKIIEIDRNALNTKKKDKIYYVEISLQDIPINFFSKYDAKRKTINFISYKSVSEFPSSTRDFSFTIEDSSMVNKVTGMLDNIQDEIIKNSFIFDFYKNEKTNTIKLGYRIIFQSEIKTLSDQEINNKTKDILSPILELNGVFILGM